MNFLILVLKNLKLLTFAKAKFSEDFVPGVV